MTLPSIQRAGTEDEGRPKASEDHSRAKCPFLAMPVTIIYIRTIPADPAEPTMGFKPLIFQCRLFSITP